ncbi:autotransporter outer membrane beta-barrel domain-containing protein [Hyphomicrobium sp. CS1GBMeth3]|uniref:autotransporter outer membrane beta-barrel domain-containing protein n=1 Tax=Hyphomicrobium sp. CS1GBMeth3 TaxID=1892845 RepID=UPI0009FA2FC8|nr:autotransporter outer membrane beta-barrel domain-containing protein [Hyphomicrobium sp. CS1GBMeth3]
MRADVRRAKSKACSVVCSASIFAFALWVVSYGIGVTPAAAQGSSVCDIGDAVGPNTLVGSQTQNSNSDAQRLAFVQQVTGTNQVVQVACSFGSGQSGTWDSTPQTTTHILVKASTIQQVFDVPDATTGQWSTQCIRNPGNQQPSVSGVFCYQVGGQTGKGSISVTKKVQGGTGTFNFTIAGPTPQNFSMSPPLDGEQTQGFGAQNPGLYTVAESLPPPAGFDLTSISCTSSNGDVFNPDVNAGTVAVDLQSGETINCTFTNAKQPSRDEGTLKIVKVTNGGDDAFNFAVDPGNAQLSITTQNGQGETNPLVLAANQTYSVEELDTAGWTLTGAICVNDQQQMQGTPSGRTITDIQLDPNEDIVCTFTNKRDDDPDDDRPEEETKRFIHRRVDNLLTYGPDRARILRRLQSDEPVQSLKDGPLKHSEEGRPDSMMLGRAPMGVTSGFGGALGSSIGLGNSPRGYPSSVLALGYNNPFVHDGIIVKDETQVAPHADPATPSIFSQFASSLMPLAAGETSFKFGTSLSEVRAAAASAEEQKARAKAERAGFDAVPYTNPYTSMRQGLDVWVEGHVARYNDNIGGIKRDGDFRILYVGADYVLAPGILVGALVQVDHTEEEINDPALRGSIDGTGWMAGPYIGVRLLDNLFFDARAAWGRSSNDIWLDDPTNNGRFDTNRWLANASLTGNEYIGPWRLSPQLAIAYGNEDSDAYTMGLGQAVGSTEATIGRLTGTMEVGYRMQRIDGTIIEPHVSIAGIWNFDTDDLSIGGVLHETDEARAKVEGGVLVSTPQGWGFRAAASYDGIGASDYDAYSGSLWINIPLN